MTSYGRDYKCSFTSFFSPSWDVHWSQYVISNVPLQFSSKHGDPVLRKWSYNKVEAARIPALPEHRTSLPMKTIIHVNNKNKKCVVLNHSYFRFCLLHQLTFILTNTHLFLIWGLFKYFTYKGGKVVVHIFLLNIIKI